MILQRIGFQASSFTSDVLQVCQQGRLVGDRLKIFDREFYLSGPGHREEVQNLVPISPHHASEGRTSHTALVEPPMTLMTAIALRKDWRVTISLRVSILSDV